KARTAPCTGPKRKSNQNWRRCVREDGERAESYAKAEPSHAPLLGRAGVGGEQAGDPAVGAAVGSADAVVREAVAAHALELEAQGLGDAGRRGVPDDRVPLEALEPHGAEGEVDHGAGGLDRVSVAAGLGCEPVAELC